MRRYYRTLIIIGIIVAISVSSVAVQNINISLGSIRFQRGSDNLLGLRLGLDLQGGSHLVYQALAENPTPEQMEGVLNTIGRRVNAFGVTEPDVQLMGNNRILVQLPGVRDIDEAKRLIGQTARLEIKERVLNVVRDTGLTMEDVVQITPEKDDDSEFVVLNVEFTEEGANQFGEVVARLKEKLEEAAQAGEPPDTLEVTLEGQAPIFFDGTEPFIENAGDNHFLIPLLNVTDLERARRQVGEEPQLAFTERFFKEDKDIGLTGDDLARAYSGQHDIYGPVVYLEFKDRGAKIFGDVTGRIAGTGNQTAIFLDDELLLSPVAQQAITGGTSFIYGKFTPERVRTIAIQLESGRLPVPIEVIQERDVDATLGAESLRKSVVAGLIGLALVLFFMAVYYRVPGLVSTLALLIYAAIVLAVFKLWPITLTLAGIAAFILSIGMAVDANILIFERMKEELRAGRTLVSSINEGFNRAWTSIRDSNVSTLITCAILFWFGDRLGASLVQGFAITLAIGVLTSMFTSITISRTFLRVVALTPLGRRLSLFVPVEAELAERRRPAFEERS